jgi:SAM-dependent methyltransferase
LQKLVAGDELPNGRALVPGCGSGYDVLELATPERSVVGIEVAEGAVERFEQLREASGVSSGRAEVVEGDFFDYDFQESFDLIWDYTFLCALPPARREAWAQRVHDLLAPGGRLVTLIFPVWDASLSPQDPEANDPDAGPPYPMSPALVESVVGGRFERQELRKVQESREGREGMEWLAFYEAKG